jgi:hypothetical protein
MQARKLMFAAVAALGVSSFAFAAPWVPTNGVAPGGAFSYSGGGDDNGLFGSPIVVPDGFVFTPVNFKAISSNGVAQTTTDKLFVTIDAAPGSELDKILINEAGDYSILGNGSGSNSVRASGAMFVTILDADWTGPRTLPGAQLLVNPAMPVSSATSAAGNWDGMMMIDIPAGVQSVRLVMNNILQATSSPGGTSIIDKKAQGIDITVIIPEPASFATILGGSLMALRRRK